MALPACMSEDGRPATFVGTMLETGEAYALCDECLVFWAAALLQGITGVDATPFIAAMSADEPAAEHSAAPGEDTAPGNVPGAAQGAPTDEPPPPAPADTDTDPPIGTSKSGYPVGRTRPGSSDPPTDIESPAQKARDAGRRRTSARR